MLPVEYFTWMLPIDGGTESQPSRFKLTREQAAAYPGAVCVDSSREMRMQPAASAHTGPLRVVAPLPKGLQTKLLG